MRQGFLPFAMPDISEAESMMETLRSGWLTPGPRVRRFEGDFAEYVGCHHAVAVNSATTALHLALRAVGKEGDEVLVPTMTSTATYDQCPPSVTDMPGAH